MSLLIYVFIFRADALCLACQIPFKPVGVVAVIEMIIRIAHGEGRIA